MTARPPPHAREHDEMIEVPMQDRRHGHARQRFERHLHRPRAELQLSCDLHDVSERRALHGERVPTTQRRQIDIVAVIRGHHRQTGQPAFGGFCLQHDRRALFSREVELHGWAGSHPLGHGLQRLDRPLDEAAALQREVRVELHASLQREISSRAVSTC